MANFKDIAGSIFSNLIILAKGSKPAKLPTNKAEIALVTDPNSLPTEEVQTMMKNFDAQVLSTRLNELEKAIYHIAGRQKEMLEGQKQLEEVVIHMATTLDEMLNGMETVQQVVDEDSDEEIIDNAWEAKKGASSLN